MRDYSMQPDEVELYSSKARYKFSENDAFEQFAGKRFLCDILLTNLSLVIIARSRKLFGNSASRTLEIPLDELKMYNNNPQVKIYGNRVELFFIRSQEILEFDDLLEARKFYTALMDYMTGSTALQRGAVKAAEAAAGIVGSLTETFGLQIRQAIRTAANQKKQRPLTEQQSLKKLKDLYEEGILSREEYESKRRKILEKNR